MRAAARRARRQAQRHESKHQGVPMLHLNSSTWRDERWRLLALSASSDNVWHALVLRQALA